MKRSASLFTRLLLAQTLLALALAGLFAALFFAERNEAVARLLAERWAPALLHAAGVKALTADAPTEVLRSPLRPEGALPVPMLSPRMAALSDELTRRGVPLQSVALARGGNGPVVWLQVQAVAGPVWLGMPAAVLVAELPLRLVLGLAIGALLLVAASWFVTRRLTRPLEQLRERMQAHRPGAAAPAAAPLPIPAGKVAPEIAAIDAAWADLLARQQRHERERALLLAGVSHDLRSPLARIRLAAGLLPDDDAHVAPRRETIVRNVAVADQLIETFLDHVRAGELVLDQATDLAVLARAVAARLERPAAELSVEVPVSLPVHASHPQLLERLLANLLDNAFQHGRAPVQLRLSSHGDDAVIEVIDAGPGIPPGDAAQALQPFARGDVSRSTPGAGLGLAIVARVVARMGGTLAFDRAEGRHRVCVRLPTHVGVALPGAVGGAAIPQPAGVGSKAAAR
jgi:two-component system, OmpR family, osmolarity sensor histidine kinase EnvZ